MFMIKLTLPRYLDSEIGSPLSITSKSYADAADSAMRAEEDVSSAVLIVRVATSRRLHGAPARTPTTRRRTDDGEDIIIIIATATNEAGVVDDPNSLRG